MAFIWTSSSVPGSRREADAVTDRRSFLQQVLALILGNALPGFDEAEFLVECGCLWCGGCRAGSALGPGLYDLRCAHIERTGH